MVINSPEGVGGDASTGPVLVGTTLGLIIETEMSSDERFIRCLVILL